jgi:hypothetical protein
MNVYQQAPFGQAPCGQAPIEHEEFRSNADETTPDGSRRIHVLPFRSGSARSNPNPFAHALDLNLQRSQIETSMSTTSMETSALSQPPHRLCRTNTWGGETETPDRPYDMGIVKSALPRSNTWGEPDRPDVRTERMSNLIAANPVRRLLLHDAPKIEYAELKFHRKMPCHVRLESILADMEALEVVRKRYPTLETADEWEDFDGAVLVHSTLNTLRNCVTGVSWKVASQGYGGKIRNLFTSLTLPQTRSQVDLPS